MPTDDMSTPRGNISEQLARLEGKVDAYMAGQSATIAEHERRITVHDSEIRELRITASSHITHDELAEQRPPKVSPWTIVGVIVAAVVGLGSMVTVMLTLMQLVAQ